MKSFYALVASFVTISLLAAPGLAQLTVFDQPLYIPATAPGAAFSSRTQTLPDDESAIAYDDFILPAGTFEINALAWDGEYSEPFPADPAPRGKTDFLVEIWAHATSAPDLSGPLHSFTLDGGFAGMSDGDVPTTGLGHLSPADPPDVPGGGGAFHYEANLPSTATLAGETRYWLSIQALQTFPNAAPTIDPTWMWHLGEGPGNGFYSYDSLFDPPSPPGELNFGKDLAFTLKAVPEPSACFLLLAGVGGLGLIRRRR